MMSFLLSLRYICLLLLFMLRFVPFRWEITQGCVPLKELWGLLLLLHVHYVLNHLMRFLLQSFLFLRFAWGLNTLDFWEEEGVGLLFEGGGDIILGGVVIR
jgi:hypothetical protein